MKRFIVGRAAFLLLLSLTLTGAFYVGAHANEFGSSTVTQTTNSIWSTSSINSTTWSYTIATSSTSESSRAVSDYNALAILLVIVLAAVLIVIRVATKRMKK